MFWSPDHLTITQFNFYSRYYNLTDVVQKPRTSLSLLHLVYCDNLRSNQWLNLHRSTYLMAISRGNKENFIILYCLRTYWLIAYFTIICAQYFYLFLFHSNCHMCEVKLLRAFYLSITKSFPFSPYSDTRIICCNHHQL